MYEKINALLKAKGVTKKSMCADIGISYNTYMSMAGRKSKNIALQTFQDIAAYLGVSGEYLIHDTSSEITSYKYTSIKKYDNPSSKHVPLVGRIAAGHPITAIKDIEDWVIIDEYDDADFALRVKGDSMTKVGIYDGDLIYVKSQPTVNNGEIAVVLVDDGFPDSSEATCKRYYRFGKTVLLKPESYNPDHKEQEIMLGSGKNVHVQGKVVFLKSYVEGR